MSVDNANNIIAAMQLGLGTELQAFLETLPAHLAPELVTAIKWAGVLQQETTCHECGEPHLGADLRRDAAYFESGNLICRRCWTFHDEGTIFNPGYKAPPWPATRAREAGDRAIVTGLIRDEKGTVVGTVEDYRAGCHMGRVTFFACGEDAEYGSLDPRHTVTNIEHKLMPI